jgi:SAM-dependent methyltransferase
MWLVDGRFSFFAEECGAAEVVAFDIIPPSARFLAEAARRQSAVRPVQGDLMDAAAMARLGPFDVVFCSGVLYHLPDPALALQRLRSLCRGQAMIGTAVIREGLTRNRAVYYHYQDALSRRWWNFRSKEQKLALDTPYAPGLDYANWFWGMSPSCVAALLQTRGFVVEHIHYRLHFAYFECTVPAVKD